MWLIIYLYRERRAKRKGEEREGNEKKICAKNSAKTVCNQGNKIEK